MQKKILLIDDEPHLVEIIANRLKMSSYQVATAVSGHEGLETAKKERPDLILLDIMMSDMDGHQVLRHLKEGADTKKIPVIMLTVRKWSEDIKKAMDKGAVDYIVKPFDPVALMEKVRGVLKDA